MRIRGFWGSGCRRLARKRLYAEDRGLQVPISLDRRPVTSSGKAASGPDPRIRHRIQIGMFWPIRVDHTNCLQVAIKTHSLIELAQSTSNQFHYRRATFSSHLKSKVGNILPKAAALRITLNIDGAPIASKSHTHPSHSTTSRLLTSSLSLGVPVPRGTQCMRVV
jgi:hypothetical protein